MGPVSVWCDGCMRFFRITPGANPSDEMEAMGWVQDSRGDLCCSCAQKLIRSDSGLNDSPAGPRGMKAR